MAGTLDAAPAHQGPWCLKTGPHSVLCRHRALPGGPSPVSTGDVLRSTSRSHARHVWAHYVTRKNSWRGFYVIKVKTIEDLGSTLQNCAPTHLCPLRVPSTQERAPTSSLSPTLRIKVLYFCQPHRQTPAVLMSMCMLL